MSFNPQETRQPPISCDACGNAPVTLTTNRQVYGEAAIDPEESIYRCSVCRASVGCHAGTTTPLGVMADSKTRALRVQAHAAFDPLWRNGPLTRKKAYNLLAYTMRIDQHACHIALLTVEQLRLVIKFGREYMAEQQVVERKRADRRELKKKERNEREHSERKRRISSAKGHGYRR
jgi:hypothetical protein